MCLHKKMFLWQGCPRHRYYKFRVQLTTQYPAQKKAMKNNILLNKLCFFTLPSRIFQILKCSSHSLFTYSQTRSIHTVNYVYVNVLTALMSVHAQTYLTWLILLLPFLKNHNAILILLLNKVTITFSKSIFVCRFNFLSFCLR